MAYLFDAWGGWSARHSPAPPTNILRLSLPRGPCASPPSTTTTGASTYKDRVSLAGRRSCLCMLINCRTSTTFNFEAIIKLVFIKCFKRP